MAARKSARQPSRLQPSRAKRAVGFQKWLRTPLHPASFLHRTAVTLTFLRAADESGQAAATTEPAAPNKIICARVAVGFDKGPASSGKAAAILRHRQVPPLEARHRLLRSPAPARASQWPSRMRTVRRRISRAFEIRGYRDGQRFAP